MKALILNSGLGRRMGVLANGHPKCMTEIAPDETILSRQLQQIAATGIRSVVITTGLYDEVLVDYCARVDPQLHCEFVKNPLYDRTNYIYSIYCARELLRDEEILLMHGDLVFDNQVLSDLLTQEGSCMAVSTSSALPEKDFKAVVHDGRIVKVGVEFFEDAVAAQPLYKLAKADWSVWLERIIAFCEAGDVNCYAEKSLNEISGRMNLRPLDAGDMLCGEIDTPEDLERISARLREVEKRTVYMCFSTDIVHSAHISLINKAAKLGKLIVGVLSDEVIASYKRFPLIPFDERKSLFENIKGVHRVMEQKTLSYCDVLRELKPTYVVHGDDWREGFQKPIRDEVVDILAQYGGVLREYPYATDEKYMELEKQSRAKLSMPDIRRGRLRKLLALKPCLSILEAHNGITGLIAEKTTVYQDGKAHQFDGMWVSSLCDSTAKGKPDIELVDMSSRLRTIDDIMEVTTKPIILDGDTGGLTQHFVYNIRTLERMGVSAVIIEDKTGLKKNSLFGCEAEQTQDSIEGFSEKIAAGKAAQKTREFMIIARIESLILERGMEDALQRAFAFTRAGADGIMIHSRKKDPKEIFEFAERFRKTDKTTPLVVVPTTFNDVAEEEFARQGINIVIYANQLMRSGFPAMQKTAQTILTHHRAKEADAMCMPIREILTLIPEE